MKTSRYMSGWCGTDQHGRCTGVYSGVSCTCPCGHQAKPSGDGIQGWVNRTILGGGGFQSFEQHEMPLFRHERDVEIANWVIRCLANPENDGAAEVLAAIQKRRSAA